MIRTERRTAPRIQVPFLVFLAGTNDARVKFETEARAVDVSTSGISLRVRHSLRVGSIVEVKLYFSTTAEEIAEAAGVIAEGEVLRVERQSDQVFKLAIRFCSYVSL